jgi:hypothetical protein
MMQLVTCVLITLFGVTAERGGYIDAVAEGVKRPSTTIFEPRFRQRHVGAVPCSSGRRSAIIPPAAPAGAERI